MGALSAAVAAAAAAAALPAASPAAAATATISVTSHVIGRTADVMFVAGNHTWSPEVNKGAGCNASTYDYKGGTCVALTPQHFDAMVNPRHHSLSHPNTPAPLCTTQP